MDVNMNSHHRQRLQDPRRIDTQVGQAEIDTSIDSINHVSKLSSSTLAKILKSSTKNQRKTLDYRLVCRQWNSCICMGPSFDFRFHLILSDVQIQDYITSFQPTLPKLKIGSIETHDLTQISAESLVSIFSLTRFENIKRFEFGEGTSNFIMQILLKNFPQIQTISFEEVWCPVFDCRGQDVELSANIHCNVNLLSQPSISMSAYDNLREFAFTQPLINHNQNQNSEPDSFENGNDVSNNGCVSGDGEELQKFFKIAFFPKLQKLDLTIVTIQDDRGTYLWVHYFIAKHYKTLQELSACFCAAKQSKLKTSSWLDLHTENEETQSQSQNHINYFEKDIANFNSSFITNLEDDKHYKEFCLNAGRMNLKNLTLSLMKQEGLQNPPWNQSLKFLTNKNNRLEEIEVNCGSQFDSQIQLLLAIQTNASTLKVLCIRNVPEFDCTVLNKCENLEAFSFGRLFTPLTQLRRESLENVQEFPAPDVLKKLRCVLIGVPLPKDKLRILAGKLKQVQILWVRGDGGDLYTVDDLQAFMKEMINLRELEMRIQMDQVQKETMAEYFLKSPEWGIRYLINEFENVTEVEFNVHKKLCGD